MRLAQPEKPDNRPSVLLVFIVISIILITVWFREGADGPLHKVRIGLQAITSPVSSAGEFVTRPGRTFLSWAGDLGVSKSELEELRDQNATLRTRVTQLEEARLENDRLTALLDISKAGDLEVVGARVIGRPVNSWEGVITIDRGSRGGVAAGMPVMSAEGLLGQTVDVGPFSARVRLISDQRSGVAAMIQSTRAEGIVQGSIDGSISMQFVSVDTTLQPGDMIITSGIGGVYPKGLVIGEVSATSAGRNEPYRKVEVHPAARLNDIEEVTVLTGPPVELPKSGGE